MRSVLFFFFFFNDTATTEIYTLSLHDALPISPRRLLDQRPRLRLGDPGRAARQRRHPGPVLPGPRLPAAAPAHVRAARGVGPVPAGDGALLPDARRPRRRRGGAGAGAR